MLTSYAKNDGRVPFPQSAAAWAHIEGRAFHVIHECIELKGLGGFTPVIGKHSFPLAVKSVLNNPSPDPNPRATGGMAMVSEASQIEPNSTSWHPLTTLVKYLILTEKDFIDALPKHVASQVL